MAVVVAGSCMRSTRLARARARLLFGARLATCAALVWVAACASGGAKRPPTGTPEPDRFLFERGTEALNRTRWLVSREYFRQLVDSYPQSPYRADAKLGVGDTYIGEGTAEAFVLGINEFREFLSYYPTHPRADYAQYKLGMAHFYQMRAPERDQTETRDAIRELEAFVQRYPSSALLPEGQKHLREAKDRLALADYRVGFFYYRIKWYPGSIDRFTTLLQRDPAYTNRDAVYYYLAESLAKAGRPAEALPYFDRLVNEFEQSEYLEASKKRAEELKSSLAVKTGGDRP
jgi:outer membrane protein assembly factor BamD